jgi:biotin carboxyl carrier protein
MRYFVTLNSQEFSLSRSGPQSGDGFQIQASPGATAGSEPARAEVLHSGGNGRPALVRVDGHLFRILGAGSALEREQRGSSAPGGTRINGHPVLLRVESELERRVQPLKAKAPAKSTRVRAPMPGRVVKLHVVLEQRVVAGAPLLGIEAMKMENELTAPNAGRVAKISVQVGSTVEADQELLVVEPD